MLVVSSSDNDASLLLHKAMTITLCSMLDIVSNKILWYVAIFTHSSSTERYYRSLPNKDKPIVPFG